MIDTPPFKNILKPDEIGIWTKKQHPDLRKSNQSAHDAGMVLYSTLPIIMP